MKVLLIDNADSFTWNLAQQIEALGAKCVVVPNTVSLSSIRRMKPDRIVLSPGPGGPRDSGVTLSVIKELHADVPILGVCLGHQCLAHVFGGPVFVGLAPTVVHGKTADIHHERRSIFHGVPSPFPAARYHSLIVKKLPEDFELLAWTGGGVGGGGKRVIMAMQHKTFPVFGVQFHPESFLTKHGNTLMQNFLRGTW